ncbi:MAG: N-acetylmuramoyl-L-alanine amidase [Vicinamibacterales bacterium]
MTENLRPKSATALAVLLFCAGSAALTAQVAKPFPQPPTAERLIADATAKEAAVRKALAARGARVTVLKAVRTVVSDYEAVVKRHPSDAVADDALWRAGMLSRDAFESFHDVHERTTAMRLLQQLRDSYPDSAHARQAPDEIEWLMANGAGASPVLADRPVRAADTPSSRAVVAAVRTTTLPGEPPANTPSVTTTSSLVTVKGIRRTILPDVVRVIIDLDGEVSYHDERLDAPTRVFVDLPTTSASKALIDQTLRFDDDSDIVRAIRVGRHANNTTRVVLEGAGIASYSVYPAYSPYRLVIDCIRSKPALASPPPGVVAPRPPAPVAAVPKNAPASAVANARKSASAAAAPVTAATVPSAPAAAAVVPAAAIVEAAANTAPANADTSVERPAWATTLKQRTTAPAPTPAAPAPVPELRASRNKWKLALPSGSSRILPEVAVAEVADVPDAAADIVRPARPVDAPEVPDVSAPAPPAKNVAGGLSIARQLGLGVSRIVIDAGHGGHDPGAQSSGVTESELVLDVALRLEKLLSKVPGVEVVMTRRENEFIALQERTAIANREGADLFLSIHANASNIPAAHGVETYFLNFANNSDAAAIAARENATSGQTMGALQDVVKTITLTSKRDESRDFATYVQREMMTSLRTQNRTLKDLGVKQAPFVVLIGASMPSILAEISFVTNPQDAKLLKSTAYRQRIAQALFDGVRKYQTSLKTAPAVAHQD